ncbi:hypothetical protein BKA70DRAFT_1452844 [Coprinopsis sp. MPI-PUGE-AT-0042]|nr:hypothetical protein BKA70DRAFT_1452844 [Coprinopsis sp. MPI-PUGE-AT-0042]
MSSHESSSESTSELRSPSPYKDSAPKGYKFVASQIAFMRLKTEDYQKATKKEQERIEAEVARHLKEDVEELSSNRMSKAKWDLLREGVHQYFRQSLPPVSASKAKRKVWTINWHARLVFQHLRCVAKRNIIKYLSRLLAQGADHPEPRDLLDDKAEYVGNDGDDGLEEWAAIELNKDDDTVGHDTKDTFTKYQTATTLLFNALSDEEKAYFKKLATRWNEKPPIDEQLRLAQKYAASRCFAFAKEMMDDMNARLYILLAYRDAKAVPSAVELDFTERLGGGPGFKTLFKKQIVKSEITDIWRQFTGVTFDEDPKASKKGEWLIRVLRGYFVYHYAAALGAPKARRDVPWLKLQARLRDYVSEDHIPDNLAEHIPKGPVPRAPRQELDGSDKNVGKEEDFYDYNVKTMSRKKGSSATHISPRKPARQPRKPPRRRDEESEADSEDSQIEEDAPSRNMGKKKGAEKKKGVTKKVSAEKVKGKRTSKRRPKAVFRHGRNAEEEHADDESSNHEETQAQGKELIGWIPTDEEAEDDGTPTSKQKLEGWEPSDTKPNDDSSANKSSSDTASDVDWDNIFDDWKSQKAGKDNDEGQEGDKDEADEEEEQGEEAAMEGSTLNGENPGVQDENQDEEERNEGAQGSVEAGLNRNVPGVVSDVNVSKEAGGSDTGAGKGSVEETKTPTLRKKRGKNSKASNSRGDDELPQIPGKRQAPVKRLVEEPTEIPNVRRSAQSATRIAAQSTATAEATPQQAMKTARRRGGKQVTFEADKAISRSVSPTTPAPPKAPGRTTTKKIPPAKATKKSKNLGEPSTKKVAKVKAPPHKKEVAVADASLAKKRKLDKPLNPNPKKRKMGGKG